MTTKAMKPSLDSLLNKYKSNSGLDNTISSIITRLQVLESRPAGRGKGGGFGDEEDEVEETEKNVSAELIRSLDGTSIILGWSDDEGDDGGLLKGIPAAVFKGKPTSPVAASAPNTNAVDVNKIGRRSSTGSDASKIDVTPLATKADTPSQVKRDSPPPPSQTSTLTVEETIVPPVPLQEVEEDRRSRFPSLIVDTKSIENIITTSEVKSSPKADLNITSAHIDEDIVTGVSLTEALPPLEPIEAVILPKVGVLKKGESFSRINVPPLKTIQAPGGSNPVGSIDLSSNMNKFPSELRRVTDSARSFEGLGTNRTSRSTARTKELHKGDKVEARKGGQEKWLKGIIENVNTDGTYDIRYGFGRGPRADISALKFMNEMMIDTIAKLEEKVDNMQLQLNNVTFCLQGYVVKSDEVNSEELLNIEKRRRKMTSAASFDEDNSTPLARKKSRTGSTMSVDAGGSTGATGSTGGVAARKSRADPYIMSLRRKSSVFKAESPLAKSSSRTTSPTSKPASPIRAPRESLAPVQESKMDIGFSSTTTLGDSMKDSNLTSNPEPLIARQETISDAIVETAAETKLERELSDIVELKLNTDSPSEPVTSNVVAPRMRIPNQRARQVFRKAAHRVIITNNIKRVLKPGGKVGIENTRLPAHLSFASRIEKLETMCDKMRRRNRTTTHALEALKITVQDQKVDQQKQFQSLQATVTKEMAESKSAQAQMQEELKSQLEAVEEKTWSTVATVNKMSSQLSKCENKILEQSDSIDSIRADQVRPSVDTTGGKSGFNVGTTDWSFLLKYVKNLNYIVMKKFVGGENSPGYVLRGALEKILKQLNVCVDFAKILKDVDDTKSVSSKQFTKALESLAWALYALLKKDREITQGHNLKDSSWIPLDNILFDGEEVKLKEGMTNLVTFIHDALRYRIDTAYISIQLKELELVATSLQESKTKHTDVLLKLTDAVAERAQYNVVYDYFVRADNKFEELRSLLSGFKQETGDTVQDKHSLSTVEDNLRRALEDTTNTLQGITSELKHKAGTEELKALAELLTNNIRKISTDLPRLSATVDRKVEMEDLERLRREILTTIEGGGDVSHGGGGGAAGLGAMMTVQSYCLSCSQPVGPNHIHDDDHVRSPAHRDKITISSFMSPKGSFPPSPNPMWNPTVASPKANTMLTAENKVIFPGMGGVRSTNVLRDRDDRDRTVISPHAEMLPTVTLTDKNGTVTTTKFGSHGNTKSTSIKSPKSNVNKNLKVHTDLQ